MSPAGFIGTTPTPAISPVLQNSAPLARSYPRGGFWVAVVLALSPCRVMCGVARCSYVRQAPTAVSTLRMLTTVSSHGSRAPGHSYRTGEAEVVAPANSAIGA